jgi:hypothetical protein
MFDVGCTYLTHEIETMHMNVQPSIKTN